MRGHAADVKASTLMPFGMVWQRLPVVMKRSEGSATRGNVPGCPFHGGVDKTLSVTMRMCACQPAAMLSFARATDLIHTVLSPMCHERRGAGSTTGKPAAMHDTPSVRVRRGVWVGSSPPRADRRADKQPYLSALSLSPSKEHRHDDAGTCSLECTYEGGGRLSCSVDIIYHEDLPTPEAFRIDMHVTLDIGAQLIVASDVSFLPAARDSDVTETVLCTCAST